MPAGDIETYFENGEWKNWVQGGEDLGGPHASKDDAVAEGREAARERNVEHIVRDEDAAVVDRADYASDDDEPSQEELREQAREGFVSRHGATSPLSTPES